MNRSKTKYCVLHNGMITWNSLPDEFKVNLSFQCSRARNGILSRKILLNIDAERHYDYFFSDMHVSTAFLTCMYLLLFKCNCFIGFE